MKSAWELSVDEAERDALRNLLVSCGAVHGGPDGLDSDGDGVAWE